MRCSIKFCFLFFFCGFWALAQEGIVQNIVFKGLQKSKENYLRKLITQTKGEAYDQVKIDNDLILLLREPAVSHAYVAVDTLASKALRLSYYIEENKTLIPAVDLWQTVGNAFAYHLGVTDYNFLGRGYTIGGFYRQNNFPGFGLILENNNFLTAQTEIKLLAQQLETLEPIRMREQLANYRYRFRSVDLNFGKDLNLKHKILFGGGIIGERYLFKEGDTIEILPEEFNTTKAAAKLGYTYDYIQPYYYHLNGWRSQFFATHVWGKSFTKNNTFFSLESKTAYFKRIKSQGNLAIRAQLGFAKNINTPFPPFAIDNNRNVRGVGNLVERGNSFWALNTEYRHSFYEKNWFVLQGNAFIDIAGIQPVGTSTNQVFQKENTHQYGGLGLRFIHKFIYRAVFRIDYGINLNGFENGALVFGIDQFF